MNSQKDPSLKKLKTQTSDLHWRLPHNSDDGLRGEEHGPCSTGVRTPHDEIQRVQVELHSPRTPQSIPKLLPKTSLGTGRVGATQV